MNSAKRNRSGNFDADDVELFLGLVNDNKALIESGKQEDKKKVIRKLLGKLIFNSNLFISFRDGITFTTASTPIVRESSEM